MLCLRFARTAGAGMLPLVQLCVHRGGDVTRRDANGWTTFQLACISRSTAVATWLLQQCVDAIEVTAEDPLRKRPLQHLITAGDAAAPAVELLLRRGETVEVSVSINGCTARSSRRR